MDTEELHKKLHPEEQRKGLKHKLQKHALKIQVIVVVLFIIAVMSGLALFQMPKPSDAPPMACFKHGVCVELIIVTGQEAQNIGLSNYTSLPEGRAMLFVFDEPKAQAMWMKGMNFAIDIFWISDKDRIVHIAKDAPPCVPPLCDIYEPPALAKYVLETKNGFANEANLFDGDKVEWKNLPKQYG